MADETKTNATPEAPGGPPPPAPEQTEQAVIPGMDGGPAPSGKVIDLSDVRAETDKTGPEASAPGDVPPEQGTMKNVGDSLFTAVQGLADGTMTYGNNYTLGLDSGAVGLAKNENYTSIVPAEIQGEIDEVEAKIVSGEIEVASAFNMSTEEVVALRDSMK